MNKEHSAAARNDLPAEHSATVAPRTLLPWRVEAVTEIDDVVICEIPGVADSIYEQDANYIVKACNAYPALIAALRPLAALSQPHQNALHPDIPLFAINGAEITKADVDRALALIRELDNPSDPQPVSK